jgi:hypothetical protein
MNLMRFDMNFGINLGRQNVSWIEKTGIRKPERLKHYTKCSYYVSRNSGLL